MTSFLELQVLTLKKMISDGRKTEIKYITLLICPALCHLGSVTAVKPFSKKPLRGHCFLLSGKTVERITDFSSAGDGPFYFGS